jgi:hypothetical protein
MRSGDRNIRIDFLLRIMSVLYTECGLLWCKIWHRLLGGQWNAPFTFTSTPFREHTLDNTEA